MYYNHWDIHGHYHKEGPFRKYEPTSDEWGDILGVIAGIVILFLLICLAIEILAYVLPIILLICLGIHIYKKTKTNKNSWTSSQKAHHKIITIIAVIILIPCLFGYYHMLIYGYNKEPTMEQRYSNMSTYSLTHVYQNIAGIIQDNNSSDEPLSFYFVNGKQNTSYQQLNNWAVSQQKQFANRPVNTMNPDDNGINVSITPKITSHSYQSNGILNDHYNIKYTVTTGNNKIIKQQILNGNATLKNIQGTIKIISNKLNI